MAAARAANQERALRFVDLGTRLGSLIELSLASKAS
jgi:hypothetical protein